MREELISRLNEASRYLKNNGKDLEANELVSFAKQLQEKDISKAKIEEIKNNITDRCNVRWLGDIYIKEMDNSYKWWNFLGYIKTLTEKL